MRPALQAVGVIVPAHDERELLPGCLDALAIAAEVVHLPVTVVVVLDSCTDGTDQVVVGRPVTAVTSSARSVGAARSLGAASVLRHWRHVEPSRLWIASTDADTHVGPTWLAEQVAIADAGADLALGTVRLAPCQAPPRLVAAWQRGYDATDGHGHVHGANLGVRGSTYLRAGGFCDARHDEDVQLVAAVAADTQACVVRTGAMVVTTSGRLEGRAPAGFAAHLRELSIRAS